MDRGEAAANGERLQFVGEVGIDRDRAVEICIGQGNNQRRSIFNSEICRSDVAREAHVEGAALLHDQRVR